MIAPATWMVPATSPDRAIPLAVDAAARDAHFESLLRRGIIVQAGPGRYSLDEAAIARRQVRRPTLVGIVLVLAHLGFIALLALLLLD